eukprot:scaffold58993_cov48-Phaeocystis_antarctica.AAC.1
MEQRGPAAAAPRCPPLVQVTVAAAAAAARTCRSERRHRPAPRRAPSLRRAASCTRSAPAAAPRVPVARSDWRRWRCPRTSRAIGSPTALAAPRSPPPRRGRCAPTPCCRCCARGTPPPSIRHRRSGAST